MAHAASTQETTSGTVNAGIGEQYVPGWGAWEGVREMFQNFMDARDALPGEQHVHFKLGNDWVIQNAGFQLKESDLILGGSSWKKEGQRGRHREGMKVGALALLREGYGVVIYTKDRAWVARLRTFPGSAGLRVLVFDSIADSTYSRLDAVTVVIRGGAALRLKFSDRLLLDAPVGRLSSEENAGGLVYVDGIYVGQVDSLRHSYNLGPHCRLNRDRDVIRAFDLEWEASSILSDELCRGVISGEEVLFLLMEGAADVKWMSSVVSPEARWFIEEAWVERYGSLALPVLNQEAAVLAEHVGLLGIVVPGPCCDVLKEYAAKLRGQCRVADERPEISDSAKCMLERCLRLVELSGLLVPEVRVVKFCDDSTMGVYADGACLIASWVLESFKDTLKTLIEESVHHTAAAAHDGTLHQKHGLHDAYCKIILSLLGEPVASLLDRETVVDQEQGD